MTNAEALRQAGNQLSQTKQVFSAGELSELAAILSGKAKSGLQPSDYCVNHKNKDSRKPELFRRVGYGLYEKI